MPKGKPSITPVLKWAGEKRLFLDQIRPLIPTYSKYYEPFIGGGSVLFDILPQRAVINDSNKELINVYNVIKKNPNALIEMLKEHNDKNCIEYFYEISTLDRDIEKFSLLTDIDRAARVIYLNKTCYNNLSRVNNIGEFISPWGHYKKPNIVNSKVIKNISDYFKKTAITIKCGDYKDALKNIRKDSFVYLDPPYIPTNTTSSYKRFYKTMDFDKEEQLALKEQCDKLHNRGIKFLLSNTSCEFIEDLFKDYKIIKISSNKSKTDMKTKRGEIIEVLIRNYDVESF